MYTSSCSVSGLEIHRLILVSYPWQTLKNKRHQLIEIQLYFLQWSDSTDSASIAMSNFLHRSFQLISLSFPLWVTVTIFKALLFCSNLKLCKNMQNTILDHLYSIGALNTHSILQYKMLLQPITTCKTIILDCVKTCKTLY